MSRLYGSALSLRSHKLMAIASLPPAPRNVISSLKPFCLRSRGRMSFSNVWVNSLALIGLEIDARHFVRT